MSSKISYSKACLTYDKQIEQLEKRGLVIGDRSRAIHLLENISYYRLSGYWYPLLQDKKNHIFKGESQLDTAFKLYCFDRELRKLVLAEIEKIEVSIRAKMVYILSQNNSPYWFTDSSLFTSNVSHAKCLTGLSDEYERSDEQFIVAFKNKYSDSLPPSWIMMEITTFGKVSMLYQILKPSKEKKEIAHYFGLADRVFANWIHSLVYLRNVCAHHTRLWNRVMSIQPQIPKTPHNLWLKNTNISNNRSYFILSMLVYLLNTVNPKHTFKKKIKGLLEKYPMVDVKAMGFPKDWEKDPFWN